MRSVHGRVRRLARRERPMCRSAEQINLRPTVRASNEGDSSSPYGFSERQSAVIPTERSERRDLPMIAGAEVP